MPVIARPIRNYTLPYKHIRICNIDANETYLLAGRGTFKTTRGIAMYMIRRVHEMPRSSGMICGLSFEDMGNNTIIPLLAGLVELGFYEGKHWVIGRRPPEHWPQPFIPILNGKYDRVMSWYNGTSVRLISLEKKAPANGVSVQWGIFDEVKFMDERKLIDSIFPAFRGNENELTPDGVMFKDCAGFLSKFFATDKEADPVKIQWLLNKRKLQNPIANGIVEAYQLQLNKLVSEFENEDTTKVRKRELEKEIAEVKEVLREKRKKLVYVPEINIDDVAPLQSEAWYKDKERNSTPRMWRVVYKNEDPEAAGDTFYPCFDKSIHTYEADYDIDELKPFIFTPDYQHSVAPITISQLGKLPGNNDITLNYVDEVYTLPDPLNVATNGNGSKGSLSEAVQLFCDRYKDHKRKIVYYVFDHTAKGRRVNANEYYKIVVEKLRENKWKVVKVYTGKAPDHYIKYSNTSDWLKHEDKSLPRILINRTRCKKLIISIQNAAAKSTNGKTEKNKEYENTLRYPLQDQSETTHFSDCFDMTNHAVLALKKIKSLFVRKRTGTR